MRPHSCLFPAALLMLALSTPAGLAQDWAKAALAKSPRHGEYVTITENTGRKLQAWVVYPEVSAKAPVVLMIHEIFGLSDWAREMADEIAGAGYIVVEPDLLSGFGPPAAASMPHPNTDAFLAEAPAGCYASSCAPEPRSLLLRVSAHQQPPSSGHPAMVQSAPGSAFVPASPGGTAAFPDQGAVVRAVSNLDPAVVTEDLDAAADYGQHLPAASAKIFVAGFCWGGGKSFLFATHRKDLSAAFVFYGPPPPAEAMKNITAPVYGFYAGSDARITATVPQTEIDMKAAGKTYVPVTYEGAGHGFMRAGEAPDANAENSAARAAAFRRFVELLGGIR
jgi:carboxymethylenebutenolidase